MVYYVDSKVCSLHHNSCQVSEICLNLFRKYIRANIYEEKRKEFWKFIRGQEDIINCQEMDSPRFLDSKTSQRVH